MSDRREDAAEKAFEAACAMTAQAKAEGWETLSFDSEELHALARLPDQIATLDRLKTLRLNNTQVADIAPLAGLTGLTVLSLNNTQVADITPLAGLTALISLGLHNTQVADIAPLAGLTRLKNLGLSYTQVSDITPVAGLTKLTTLNLSNTPVAEITSIAGLTGLTSLGLSYTQVKDITPLAGLTGLTALGLSYIQVTDITPLARLTGLTSLWLNNTQVTDITPLSGLTAMQDMDLTKSAARDLRPLLGLRRLVEKPGTFGLQFRDCTAAKTDPRIAEISLIEDNAERARALFDYLEGWEQPPPPRDPLLEAIIVDGRLEVPPDLPAAAEAEDRVKRVVHERLRDKAKALAQAAGNTYPRLATRARALLMHVDKPFEDLDLLTIHLEVEDLADRATAGTEDGIPFDDTVAAALGDVARLGPGLTRGNEAVELFCDRLRQTREAPTPEADRAVRERLSEATLAAPEAHGPNSLALERQMRQIADQAVVDTLRRSKQRGMLWRLGVVAAAESAKSGRNIGEGMIGGLVATAFGPAITGFVIANWQTLLAAAATYGAAFSAWFVGAVGVLLMAKGVRDEIRERAQKEVD